MLKGARSLIPASNACTHTFFSSSLWGPGMCPRFRTLHRERELRAAPETPREAGPRPLCAPLMWAAPHGAHGSLPEPCVQHTPLLVHIHSGQKWLLLACSFPHQPRGESWQRVSVSQLTPGATRLPSGTRDGRTVLLCKGEGGSQTAG